MFAPEKATLTQQKVDALKGNLEKEYLKLVHVMRLAYQRCLLVVTKKACDEINLRPVQFQLTMRQYMEDVEKREELEAMEKRVRIEVEGKQVKQTLEQIQNAAKFKLKKD